LPLIALPELDALATVATGAMVCDGIIPDPEISTTADAELLTPAIGLPLAITILPVVVAGTPVTACSPFPAPLKLIGAAGMLDQLNFVSNVVLLSSWSAFWT